MRPLLWFTLAATLPSLPVDAAVTFSQEIARLFQDRCQVCHHDGGLGPFPLLSYSDAASHLRAIKPAVMSRRMPDGASMRMDTGCCTPETFEGVRRLTQEEIDTIVGWVDAGAPEGNPADLPPPLTFTDGVWKGGDPEFTFPNAPDGFTVPANLGRDVFRRFPLRTDFPDDRYITTFEALPGSGDESQEHLNRTVHHVTLFIDPDCKSLEQEAEFAASNPVVKGPGFEGEFTYPTALVGMWFPGTAPLQLQPGAGIKVPRGACFVMEVHYATYHQEPVVDHSLVGLQFSHVPVQRERLAVLVKNEQFVIPAGDPRYRVDANLILPQDAILYSVTPHMHQLGTDFFIEARLPDGGRICLGDVEWDFRHQGTYIFREPLSLPAGANVAVTCVYDNSADNPWQIDQPPKDVPFGKFSDKEMCQLTLGLTYQTK
jgi:hypothetical protein